MKTSSELRAQAWGVLSGKWGMAVVATLVYMVICVVISLIPYVSYLAFLLVSLPLGYGFIIMFLNMVRGSDVQLDTMGEGFKDYVCISVLVDVVAHYPWNYQGVFVCVDSLLAERPS